jgi:hypothetical protein
MRAFDRRKTRGTENRFFSSNKKIIADRWSHNVENIQSIVLRINDKPVAL